MFTDLAIIGDEKALEKTDDRNGEDSIDILWKGSTTSDTRSDQS